MVPSTSFATQPATTVVPDASPRAAGFHRRHAVVSPQQPPHRAETLGWNPRASGKEYFGCVSGCSASA
eukprot:10139969-Lingulodinium_polyedra.AAC.1